MLRSRSDSSRTHDQSTLYARSRLKSSNSSKSERAIVRHFVPAASMTEAWVQKRAERLGYGMPAIFPEEVPQGRRIRGIPLRTWAESAGWAVRSALLYPLPPSKLRFWAIWKNYYMRGYRAGVRRYAPQPGMAK